MLIGYSVKLFVEYITNKAYLSLTNFVLNHLEFKMLSYLNVFLRPPFEDLSN